MPGTGWETPQMGSIDLGAELRQWGSESADLLSDRFTQESVDLASDWEAVQLALEPGSFELDGELAQFGRMC
jgi:hypothetical protein